MKKTIASVLLATMVLVPSITAQAQLNPILTMSPVPCFRYAFNGDPDRGYAIESSTNMLAWTALVELPANASGIYAFTNIPSSGTVFYRTVAQCSQPPVVPLDKTVEYGNITVGNPANYSQYATFWFNISAANCPVWISRDPKESLLISTNTVGLSVTTASFQSVAGGDAGSTATEHYIAPGAVKLFALTIRVAGPINASYGTVALTGIRYGLSSATATNYNIASGLEDLQAMFPH